MILGFTGSREGMTPQQLEGVYAYLLKVVSQGLPLSVHHGGCIGADHQFHTLCLALGIADITVHPSIYVRTQARCDYALAYCNAKPPLARNKDIVDVSTRLIVAPKTAIEILRSGTWSTYRYALKKWTAAQSSNIIVLSPVTRFRGNPV